MTKHTPNGWMWWVAQYKEKHPDNTLDYKTLMQQYIKGILPMGMRLVETQEKPE